MMKLRAMTIPRRLQRLLRLPPWEQLNRLSAAWASLKTRTLYRLAFGTVGTGTVVYRPLMLSNTHLMHIGSRVTIRDGARFDLVTERYGVRYSPRVEIGDDSSFEQNFHLACAQEIIIGRKVAVTENVGIFDIWHPYQDLSKAIVDQPLQTAPVSIGDETLIGMGVVVQPGVRIGKHCLIGANSVVTQAIPDYSIAVGIPARVVKRYDPMTKGWVKVP